MDCREFRDKHFAYIDDVLPGIDLVRVQRHVAECDACAKHDTLVRRSLLLFRNLPRIEPSPDFGERLERRLREVKPADAATPDRSVGRIAASVLVAAVLGLGYFTGSLLEEDAPTALRFPPVVATLPAAVTSPIARPAPAVMASVSAGIPIWTAALFADQAPAHFASLEQQIYSSER